MFKFFDDDNYNIIPNDGHGKRNNNHIKNIHVGGDPTIKNIHVDGNPNIGSTQNKNMRIIQNIPNIENLKSSTRSIDNFMKIYVNDGLDNSNYSVSIYPF
jgi:hypothetical protein